MRYVIGMDGGGTNTTARLWYLDSGAGMSVTGASINVCSNPPHMVHDNLKRMLTELLAIHGDNLTDCVAICVGSAGITTAKTCQTLRDQITRVMGNNLPMYITDDMEVCLAGAIRADAGVALLSGTGSFCIGRDMDGECWRKGGLGHIVGDEGSAYDIGRTILMTAIRAYDGRGPQTLLVQLLASRMHIKSIDDIVDYVYMGSGKKEDIAKLAPLLCEACAADDAVAVALCFDMAQKLYELCAPVMERVYPHCKEVALCGGVLMNFSRLKLETELLLKKTHPDLSIHDAVSDAAQGAVCLAKQLLSRGRGG